MSKVILPKLEYLETPNQSDRHVRRPHLIVLHRWGNSPARTEKEASSRYLGNLLWMMAPKRDVSAHIVYGGGLCPPGERAAQLVRWDRKAWTQASLNSVSYSIESADAIWELKYPHSPQGSATVWDEQGFSQLARITAFICLKANIPPMRSLDPIHKAGIVQHNELGLAGNPHNHRDVTENAALWRRFIRTVQDEYRRGEFRKTWGRGRWYPLSD